MFRKMFRTELTDARQPEPVIRYLMGHTRDVSQGYYEPSRDVLKKAIGKDKRFAYPGFGTFTVRKRKARTGRNPQTGDKIKIAASKTVAFKPAPKFKGSL